MTNERFQSQMESDNEEQWLPMQVLRTVQATPTLPDDIQVMIMKVCTVRVMLESYDLHKL